MKDRNEFLKDLSNLVVLARKNGNQMSVEKVKEYFAHSDLTEGQIELVFDYLLAQKVVVKGYLKTLTSEEQPAITYTEEEKAYLESYGKEIEEFEGATLRDKEELFEKVVQGQNGATERLTELYLSAVVEIAKEMHHPEIFIGDMIQEGGLGLLLGIRQIEDVEHAHETILTNIRQSIRTLIEEFEASKKKDCQMLEQVTMLDEAIKQLTDELGRKVTMDELAIHLGMTEEEITDILRLMGEEVESEYL